MPSKKVTAKKNTKLSRTRQQTKKKETQPKKNEKIQMKQAVSTEKLLSKRKTRAQKNIVESDDEFNEKKQIVQLIRKEDQNYTVCKKQGEKTLIEIIEDTKSGVPAKSELEIKEQKAFLKIQKRKNKQEEKESAKSVKDKKSEGEIPIQLLGRPKCGAQSQISKSESNSNSINKTQSIQQQPVSIIAKARLRENAIALANENREITVVNSTNNKLSSLSFMKRQPAEKWKPEETKKFFMALQIFGTDFSLIEKVFNQERTREQIKNKFRKEERKNKKFIDELLNNKERKSLKDFEALFGKADLGLGDQDDFVDEAADLFNSDEESSDDNEDDSDNSDEDQSDSKVQEDESSSVKGDSKFNSLLRGFKDESSRDSSKQNSAVKNGFSMLKQNGMNSSLSLNQSTFNISQNQSFQQRYKNASLIPKFDSNQVLKPDNQPSNIKKFTINTF
ncbi:myb domain-containing protein [Stylonychia lemnae]|uniref:Myb domain-containing protein n=1 Tax=Stylonychia lemnae TaxID=5949 RepID=A0A077ZUA0_STYLE|nr:myb domain-containing protein [Stylonychia lemnae]|eukprot:CDW72041.1 myb domain-containing protein [Stylonychia lemnae]